MTGKAASTIERFKVLRNFELQEVQVNTAGGSQGVALFDENQIIEVLEKYNTQQLKQFAKLGIRTALHRLAGYQVSEVVTVEIIDPQKPDLDRLILLGFCQLKALFYYRSAINDGFGEVPQLVESIDPIFWDADIALVSLAFCMFALKMEESCLERQKSELALARKTVKQRKKDIANLQSGKVLHVLPAFGDWYQQG